MKKSNLLLLMMGMLIITLFSFSSSDHAKGISTFEPLVRGSKTITHYGTSDQVMIPSTYTEKTSEFRAVWVATVYNLNMPIHTSETQYKAAYENLLDEVLESKMNAIIFQVRPNNDAFYDSIYAPWSRWLTGTEGNDPGWNVMEYMVTEAHRRGIEFHAWLNPYRVANTTLDEGSYLNTLHNDNFAKQNPNLVVSGIADSNGRNPLVLNPGEPQVKTYIQNVVAELMTNYDVDGIHFDDYFYPYSGIISDITTYNTYKSSGQSIEDWRRENVNDVVRGVKNEVDAHNLANGKDIRFGISPFGLWGSSVPGYSTTLPEGSNTSPGNLSSYHKQYADSKKWVDEGWVHYINPQVYWNFEHTTAPYADVVDWWASVVRGTDVDLVIGHAPSAAHSGSWLTDEISAQLRYNLKHPEIKGEVMYSASYLDHPHMNYVENNNWITQPLNTWETSAVLEPSISVSGTLNGNVYTSNVAVTITSVNEIFYKLNIGDPWTLYTTPLNLTTEGVHTIYAKAVDGLGNESLVVGENITIQKENNDIPVISVIGEKIGEDYLLNSIVRISATEDIYVAINHGSVGEFELYTGDIILDDLGRYFIRAKTINSDNVESEVVELSLKVVESCNTDPIISITGEGNAPYYKNATISLSSPSPSILYKLNDGNWETYTSAINVTTEGVHTITYKNSDACATEISSTFTIDTTAPSTPTLSITGLKEGWYYKEITTFEILDSEPSSKSMYRLHNGKVWSSWGEYSDIITLPINATYTLEYYSVDQAGNESEILTERFRLDIPASETNLYVIRDGEIVTYYNSNEKILLPIDYTEKTEEIRAVWVATVSNIDLKKHTSEADYKSTIITMLDRIEANNFNTMFFQVRPMNDAFYDSEYAPWSRYLTGVEGNDPGWDVFGFLIEEAHKRGIEVHAWLNPYRVSSGTSSKSQQLALLHPDNFARKNPDLVLVDKAGKLILNPGEKQVQAYIKNVIQELINKYDVDGIHFDDYFYSYHGMNDSEDSDLYNRNKETGQSLDDWRRENINVIIEDIYNIVEIYNTTNTKTVKFGVSPFGIWSSTEPGGSNTSPYTMQSYKDQYADTKKWVEEGWVHYIIPQLYWEFDHKSAPYADLVDWWAELAATNHVDLIIGHGFYRYDDDSWDDENELLEQLRYASQYESIVGHAFFSYKILISSDQEVLAALDRLNNYYWKEYATFPWVSPVVKEEIIQTPVCGDDQTLVDGVCVNNPPVCEDDQTLVDGVCIDNPPVCEEGFELKDNVCVAIETPTSNNAIKVALIVVGATISLATIIALLKKYVL